MHDVNYTLDSENVFSDHGTVFIPRKEERFFLDEVLYEVEQVYYWIDSEKPSKKIEVALIKI